MKSKKNRGKFNVADALLNQNLSLRGQKTAIYCGKESVTYEKLFTHVNKFANILKSLGVKPTERVMIHLPDSPMFFYAFLGSIKYGAWPVPVNTMLNESDYEYMIDDMEARVLVTEKRSNAATIKTNHLCYKLFSDMNLPILMGFSEPTADTYPADADDIAFWLYSSGSTGRPKGVPHRHIDMIHSADHYAKHVINMNENDVVFSVSKLFFAYGLGNSLSFPLRYGASTVLLSSPPTPESVMETVATFKPTVFFGVPTQYNSVLKKATILLNRSVSAHLPERHCHRQYLTNGKKKQILKYLTALARQRHSTSLSQTCRTISSPALQGVLCLDMRPR